MDNKNNFWQSEKGKAAIKLGLWMIFIIILIVIVIFSERNNVSDDINNIDTPTDGNTEVETPVYEFVNYREMQDKLLENNYEYVYTISNLDSKYIYSGMKSDGKEIGYREDANGIIKYYIDETGTYQVNLDNALLIDTLYQNVDASYLDIYMLFENLSEYLYSIDKNEGLRTITYDKDGYQVSVLTDTENIKSITIVVDTTTYELEFNKIGECEGIDFTI